VSPRIRKQDLKQQKCRWAAWVIPFPFYEYPLVNKQFANENGPFIVDLPIKNGDLPSFFVSLPGRVSPNRTPAVDLFVLRVLRWGCFARWDSSIHRAWFPPESERQKLRDQGPSHSYIQYLIYSYNIIQIMYLRCLWFTTSSAVLFFIYTVL
jgi:hypothetical protein